MIKTLKVEGDALKKDAEAIIAAANRVEDEMEARLKVLLGIAPEEHCHVDVEWLEEHGMAFARTGCGGGGLSDLLAKMMGGVKAADKPGVH